MIEWLLVLIAIPFGFWLRRETSEEIKPGKPWFTCLIIIGIIGVVGFIFMRENVMALTCLAIAIVAGISLKR